MARLFLKKREAELKHMRYENMRLRGILEEAAEISTRYRGVVIRHVIWMLMDVDWNYRCL